MLEMPSRAARPVPSVDIDHQLPVTRSTPVRATARVDT